MNTCGDNGLNVTFIVEGQDSACSGISTNTVVSCSGNTSIDLSTNDVAIKGNILPKTTDTYDVGTPTKRFRNINTINGQSTVWTSTVQINTPNLSLGLDSLGNNRTITADNSIIQQDILNGGNY
jgi:hypothetical protein